MLLLQSVSLKMSESEHWDSEFYYPGEQSDSEMLHLLTTLLIGSLKMRAKRSNAATRGSSFHQKQ